MITLDPSVDRSPEFEFLPGRGHIRKIDDEGTWVCAYFDGMEVELQIKGLTAAEVFRALMPESEWRSVVNGLLTAAGRYEANAKDLYAMDAPGVVPVADTFTGQSDRARKSAARIEMWLDGTE